MEECIVFGKEAGFIQGKELEDAEKMLRAVKRGVKPPPCRGRDECDAYCSEAEHFEECVNFAEAAGFMTAEEAVLARKTQGKGPGGCRNKDECEAFCQNPDNQETCFNFAKENGLIPEADLKQMEENKQKLRESLNQAPRVVLDCLNLLLGSDLVEKIKSGQALPPREANDQMRACFEKMRSPAGEEGRGQMPPGQTGPGGCQSPAECQAFCENNPQECQNFGPQPEGPARLPPAESFQNPPEGFPPPPDQFPPAEPQLMTPSVPSGEQAPPANENPTLPGSFLGPNSLLGSILSFLLGKLSR
jgi:hypothetical protein